MVKNCYHVIIAGGKGTRFWPLSRAERPKQLLKILSRKSLIAETVARVAPLGGARRTLVVTIGDQLTALRKELPRLPRANFIAEPQGKNTAPCIGLAALEVMRRDADGMMVVLPADHWVPDSASFRRTIQDAVTLAAREDRLITIGIRPDYPETGYGYIMKHKAIATTGSSRAFHVRRFREKPGLNAARRLIRHGSLWNSGIFVWRAGTLLELLRRYQPAIGASLRSIAAAAGGNSLAAPDPGLRAVIGREYRKMPSISVDYAVLEKAAPEGRVLTLEAGFAWSDVGSWTAVHRMMRKDAAGNAGNGRWLQLGAKNCLIHGSGRLVALLGVADVFVIDTPDALLVGDLRRSQETRDLVDELHRRRLGRYALR